MNARSALSMFLAAFSICVAVTTTECEPGVEIEILNNVFGERILGLKMSQIEAIDPSISWHDTHNSTDLRRQRSSSNNKYNISYNRNGVAYMLAYSEKLDLNFSHKKAHEINKEIRTHFHDRTPNFQRNTDAPAGCDTWVAGKVRFYVATIDSHGKVKILLELLDRRIEFVGKSLPSNPSPEVYDGCSDLSF